MKSHGKAWKSHGKWHIYKKAFESKHFTLIGIQNVVRDNVVSKNSGDEFIAKNLQESQWWKWSGKIANFTLICIQNIVTDTVGSKSIQPPWRLTLTAIVNKSCNIVCCVYNNNVSNHPKYDFFKI